MIYSRRLVSSLSSSAVLAGLLLAGVNVAPAQVGVADASTRTPVAVPRTAKRSLRNADQFAELGTALVAGRGAVEKLRENRIDTDSYRLALAISRMGQCVASEDESTVACYIEHGSESAAQAAFDALLVQLRSGLSKRAWKETRETAPAFVRVVRFRHVESGAVVDLDIGRAEGGAFRVWVIGTPARG